MMPIIWNRNPMSLELSHCGKMKEQKKLQSINWKRKKRLYEKER